MALEVEAKMAVEAFESIRARLQAAGATAVGRFLETNVFLDTEDRSLLAADEGLRMRANKDLATGRSEYIVTYKGPRQLGALKTREEVELVVSSGGDAVTLLERLGYLTMISFEKRRESYHLADCKVELDEMPHLGLFVEVEGPDEPSVMAVRAQLQLADRPMIKTSYVALLLSYLQERGESRRKVTFGQ